MLDYTRKFYLNRVRLNTQGYDSYGSYYGTGAPLWRAIRAMGLEEEKSVYEFRSTDRASARAYVKANEPNATFFR